MKYLVIILYVQAFRLWKNNIITVNRIKSSVIHSYDLWEIEFLKLWPHGVIGRLFHYISVISSFFQYFI